VFSHSNPLFGLKKGGVFIIQSDLETAGEVWNVIPPTGQKYIIDNDIKVFYLDAFKIAREEASDPDLQLRMQGIAFQGAFFAASPVAERANLSQQRLLDAIHTQLQHKFGSKGARVVQENLAVVKRGFDEVRAVPHGAIESSAAEDHGTTRQSDLPIMLKSAPQSPSRSKASTRCRSPIGTPASHDPGRSQRAR